MRGVLTRNPDWAASLVEYQVESAWMVGAWSDVEQLTTSTSCGAASVLLARIMLAMRAGDAEDARSALAAARAATGTSISAAGVKGYRRCYDSVLDLHLIHELELIHEAACGIGGESVQSQNSIIRANLGHLSVALTSRFNSTLPSFKIREPILSLRRTAFALKYALFIYPGLYSHHVTAQLHPNRWSRKLAGHG